uniref:Uncharacterized protein n=1 Tax=Oryza sativa subsp. japonica TaxID=39947 RepID=Q6Z2I0_ORYSJ|nr:hypothetical protein [Oryza sativa Japonica Group]
MRGKVSCHHTTREHANQKVQKIIFNVNSSAPNSEESSPVRPSERTGSFKRGQLDRTGGAKWQLDTIKSRSRSVRRAGWRPEPDGGAVGAVSKCAAGASTREARRLDRDRPGVELVREPLALVGLAAVELACTGSFCFYRWASWAAAKASITGGGGDARGKKGVRRWKRKMRCKDADGFQGEGREAMRV